MYHRQLYMASQLDIHHHLCYESGRAIGLLDAALAILSNEDLDTNAKTHAALAVLTHLADDANEHTPNKQTIQLTVALLKARGSVWSEDEIQELATLLSEARAQISRAYAEQVGEIKSEFEESRLRRNEAARKMDVVRRVEAISKEARQDFFHLVSVAKEVELNAAWTLELSDLSDAKLARTIKECRAMGDEAFKKHITGSGGLKTLPRFLKMVARDSVMDYKPKSKKAPDTKSSAAKAAKQP